MLQFEIFERDRGTEWYEDISSRDVLENWKFRDIFESFRSRVLNPEIRQLEYVRELKIRGQISVDSKLEKKIPNNSSVKPRSVEIRELKKV